ncbi:MAG: hypothetical protein ACK5PT_11450, partial [Cereibacter sp.]
VARCGAGIITARSCGARMGEAVMPNADVTGFAAADIAPGANGRFSRHIFGPAQRRDPFGRRPAAGCAADGSRGAALPPAVPFILLGDMRLALRTPNLIDRGHALPDRSAVWPPDEPHRAADADRGAAHRIPAGGPDNHAWRMNRPVWRRFCPPRT